MSLGYHFISINAIFKPGFEFFQKIHWSENDFRGRELYFYQVRRGTKPH